MQGDAGAGKTRARAGGVEDNDGGAVLGRHVPRGKSEAPCRAMQAQGRRGVVREVQRTVMKGAVPGDAHAEGRGGGAVQGGAYAEWKRSEAPYRAGTGRVEEVGGAVRGDARAGWARRRRRAGRARAEWKRSEVPCKEVHAPGGRGGGAVQGDGHAEWKGRGGVVQGDAEDDDGGAVQGGCAPSGRGWGRRRAGRCRRRADERRCRRRRAKRCRRR